MLEQFAVDVEKRQVTHESGVSFSFYCYRSEQDWERAGPSVVRNHDLYDGNYLVLAKGAKIAALHAGMRHF
jgi:hypothetical protein